MDRYFLDSRERTTQTRKIVNQWRGEVSKRRREIGAVKRYKGRDHGLDQALESTIDYLKEKMGLSAEDAKKLLPTVELLTGYHVAETERLKGLEAELRDYQTKIHEAYAEYSQNSSYSLFAVWVHAGVAGSGHYWAYMRCGKRVIPKKTEEEEKGDKKEGSTDEKGKEKENKPGNASDAEMKEPEEREWLKLNDLKISDTNEVEVMNQSIGGNAMSTAYFLIYMDSKMFAKLQESPVPIEEDESKLVTSEIILKEIQEDNAKFLETLEKYNKSQNEDKTSRFFNSVENQQASARSLTEEAEGSGLEKDARIKSYYAFLYSIGALDPLQNEIINREYSYIFSRGLETDIDTSIYAKVQDKLGKETIGAALAYKLEDAVSKTYATEYKQFRQVAQYYVAGLQYFVEQRIDSAFAVFQRALEMDRQIAYGPAKRQRQIEATIHTCLQILLSEAERRCNPHEYPVAIELFQSVAKGSLCVLSRFNPAAHAAIRDRLTLLFNVKQLPMPNEAYSSMSKVIQVLYIPLGTAEANSQIAPVPRLADLGNDDEKWNAVYRNMMEKLDVIKVRYPEIWQNFMPQPPPKEKADVKMPDLIPG